MLVSKVLKIQFCKSVNSTMAIVKGFNKVQDHTRITLKHTTNHKAMKNSFNSSVKSKKYKHGLDY